MKKSKVIATCLVNSNMFNRIEDAEHAVPGANYLHWDREMDDAAAEHIIKTVGRASRINVKLFIEDLK